MLHKRGSHGQQRRTKPSDAAELQPDAPRGDLHHYHPAWVGIPHSQRPRSTEGQGRPGQDQSARVDGRSRQRSSATRTRRRREGQGVGNPPRSPDQSDHRDRHVVSAPTTDPRRSTEVCVAVGPKPLSSLSIVPCVHTVC